MKKILTIISSLAIASGDSSLSTMINTSNNTSHNLLLETQTNNKQDIKEALSLWKNEISNSTIAGTTFHSGEYFYKSGISNIVWDLLFKTKDLAKEKAENTPGMKDVTKVFKSHTWILPPQQDFTLKKGNNMIPFRISFALNKKISSWVTVTVTNVQ